MNSVFIIAVVSYICILKCHSLNHKEFTNKVQHAILIDGRFVNGQGLQLDTKRVGENTPSDKKDGVISGWFTQTLDHFDEGNPSTFKQRYFINNKYANTESRRAFLHIGGEGPLSAGSIETDGGIVMHEIMMNAKIHEATVFALEHRYYGESLPDPKEGLKPSRRSLRFLSSRQAVKDAAAFMKSMSEEHDMDDAWVIFGGSYAGNLAAWIRLKHPEIVTGAISSSAPVLAKTDFHEYLSVVGADLETRPSCYNKVKEIFTTVETLMKTQKGRHTIHDKLPLCNRFTTLDDDAMGTFYDMLASPFMTIAQYGGDNVLPYSRESVDSICARVEEKSEDEDDLDRLIGALRLATDTSNMTCFDGKYHDFVQNIRTNQNYLPWFWQKCTEFGYFKTTNADDQPFGKGISLQFRVDPCQKLFGISLQDINNAVDSTNQYYGGRETFNTTQVVLMNGSQDPWHSLGMFRKEDVGNDRTIVYMNGLFPVVGGAGPMPQGKSINFVGTAHCADFYPPSWHNDKPDLKKGRAIVTKAIGEWLKK